MVPVIPYLSLPESHYSTIYRLIEITNLSIDYSQVNKSVLTQFHTNILHLTVHINYILLILMFTNKFNFVVSFQNLKKYH